MKSGPEKSGPGGGTDHERPRVILDENGDLDTIFLSHINQINSHLRSDASQLLAYKALKESGLQHVT